MIIFLDRDGVLNRFPGKGRYVTRWSPFSFLPGAKKAVRLLSDAGHELVVISNQGGVSRGLLTKKDLQGITDRMLGAVERSGGKIHKVFYCIHQTSDACNCSLYFISNGIHSVQVSTKQFYGDISPGTRNHVVNPVPEWLPYRNSNARNTC